MYEKRETNWNIINPVCIVLIPVIFLSLFQNTLKMASEYCKTKPNVMNLKLPTTSLIQTLQ